MTAALDAALGDAWDEANPVGYHAVLAADERQEMLAEGERLLAGFGLNAEFVPAELGGRLVRADHLAETLRTLWRRDPCLGLGYGFSSLIAAVNVWSTGSQDQRRATADLLLAGDRIAAAFHELDHGNDFANAGFTARAAGSGSGSESGWILSGRKEIVTNLRRADAVVLFARTSQAPGSRSHSQFLLTRAALPPDRVRDLPRQLSSGMRGVQLGGAEFTDCPVPADAMLGKPGQGIEIALRSYLVTRAIFPAICAGPLDSALRVTIQSTLDRSLYGGAVADIPYVRAVIARTFADLLAIDAFAAVGLRGLHLAPEAMPIYAPAAKYLTSRILLDAFEDLRAVLGARSYLRQGPYAVFQKLGRDVALATFAHVSRSACLVTILPQLPRLARKSWLVDPPGSDTRYDLGADLPALDLGRLAAVTRGGDGILASLVEAAELEPTATLVGRFAARFLRELRTVRDGCLTLAPADLTIDASPAAFALADRYTVLLAAACALGVWRHGGGRYPEFALLGVLDRLVARLGGAPVLTVRERESVEQALFEAAVERFQDRRLFGLADRRLPG